MTIEAEDWLNDLRYIANERTPEEKEEYRSWGFTIYRTSYAPSSEQAWDRLLNKIQTFAYSRAQQETDSEEQDPIFKEIWSKFRLDARSDQIFAEIDIDQLRNVYNDHEGSKPMNADYRTHRVFLVADDECLCDPEIKLVKCVDADYVAADYVPKSVQRGRQRYFGWMPMRPECIAELWRSLDMRELCRIAPQTIGGTHLVVWHGH